jgi:hypothetical protein
MGIFVRDQQSALNSSLIEKYAPWWMEAEERIG